MPETQNDRCDIDCDADGVPFTCLILLSMARFLRLDSCACRHVVWVRVCPFAFESVCTFLELAEPVLSVETRWPTARGLSQMDHFRLIPKAIPLAGQRHRPP